MSSLQIQTRQQRLRPRFGPISAALAYSGVSRSRLYEWARERPELLRKNGRASLVDFDTLDAVLSELPIADLKQSED